MRKERPKPGNKIEVLAEDIRTLRRRTDLEYLKQVIEAEIRKCVQKANEPKKRRYRR